MPGCLRWALNKFNRCFTHHVLSAKCGKGGTHLGLHRHGFRDELRAVPLLNSSRFSQLVLETNRKQPSSLLRNMTVQTHFDAISFLHSLSVVSFSVKPTDRKIALVYTLGTLTSLWAQRICKDFGKTTQSARPAMSVQRDWAVYLI